MSTKAIVHFFYFTLLAIPIVTGHLIEKRYVDGDQNLFDVEMFRAANEHYEDQNVLISPISLRIALGMVLEGARDETATEIRRALRLPDDQALIRQETKKWVDLLTVNDAGNTTLKTANRIFIDLSYKINQEYRRTLNEIYSADVKPVDKDDSKKTAEEINEWVKEHTNGQIPTIIHEDDINDDFVMAEVNSIYFKGSWQYQFRESHTTTECFYKNGKDCVQTEMMKRVISSLPHNYIKELGAEAVDLPYDDKKHSMLILLPEKRDGINELVQKMRTYKIDQISPKLNQKSVLVRIPKFTAKYKSEMRGALESLKIARIFGAAQLYGMLERSDQPLKVSKVIHSSKIEVNEKGSEAAAATIVQIVNISANAVAPWIPFTANRPFLYFLRDVSTNAVLFAGKYIGPTGH